MIKVSICCTVYNHERYLRDALEGFVKQKTNFGYEVIVHDDASTDGSAQIIREYEHKYPDIIKPIYQTENQHSKGVPIGTNFIYPKMSGEYIALCEGDDYWTDETKLQKQVDFLDAHSDYVACVHNSVKLDLWHGTSEEMYHRDSDCDLTFADVIPGGSACFHTSSLMYRRWLRNDLPQYMRKRGRGFGDYPMAIYLATMGKIRYINKPMSVYRWGAVGSYTMVTSSSMEKMLKIYEKIDQLLADVDQETGGKYSDLIRPVKLQNLYTMTERKGDYPALRKEPLKSIYDSQSWRYKLKIYVLQYSGPLGKAFLEYQRKKLVRK